MNIAKLKTLVESGLSQPEIASKLNTTRGKVRYQLTKNNLITKHAKFGKTTPSYKCKCGEINKNNFYGHKTSMCKKCHIDYTTQKGYRNRDLGISLLGGQCSVCGYKKSISALEFHHIEDENKDPSFKSLRGWSKSRLKNELKKCILLCSNCHREEHERLFLERKTL